MFQSSEKVTVKGFFAAPRVAIMIHPGSWWSGVAHVMFEGDQVVTAVPRSTVYEFNEAEKVAPVIKVTVTGRKVGAPPIMAAPYGSRKEYKENMRQIIDTDLSALEKRIGADCSPEGLRDYLFALMSPRRFIHVIPEGVIYKFKGIDKITTAFYVSAVNNAGKVINFPITEFAESNFLGEIKVMPTRKRAIASVENVNVKEHFKPGTFFNFSQSPRLWMVDSIDDQEGVINLSLACEDDSQPLYKPYSIASMVQAYRSGQTVKFRNYEHAVKRLSRVSAMTYFNPLESDE